jgi:class 3 adenylate cyclase
MVDVSSQASDEILRCPACGASNSKAARFCNQCSKPLGTTQARAPIGAERKQVTVLFSDLTGFTALSERLDPEETREIMNRVFGLAAEIVARYNGRIEKFIGDAMMAIFGVPVAHEDDPVRAVRAALELHEAVAALSPQVQARTGTPIALHSGVNTGLVVTGELQFDQGTAGPLGDTINTAARLMNAAPSSQIWVGPETRRLIQQTFELEDLGAHDFKGKAAPVGVARVLSASSRAARANQFRGTFVGRQAELGALLGAAEKMRDGEPSVFAIRGDAGTGKTRLVAEFRERVGSDVQWLEGRAYPYAQNIPYAPIIDLLSRSWSIEERDSQATVRAKLEAGLAALLPTLGEVLPLFLHLYHLPQTEGVVIERQAFQERLLAAMRQLLTALARRAPTVVCVQDLHWADNSTVILLNGLAEDLHAQVLLLSNYRPGYTPPSAATELELRELSPRQTAELLTSLLEGKPPEALTRFIEERSDGNPFYVEEVVNSLVETGVLQRESQGWTLIRSLAEAGVPATVTGVIAARIDRLDELRRRILRHAAVVGREFLYAIVAQVTEDTAELAPSLNELQAADLIRTRRPEPALEYIFKHALTQEVAYDGLLKTERRMLHERTAYAMESVLSERIDEFVETLAYHFLRGGVTDKAIHYLVESGRKCVARYALPEATAHFREAYALIVGGDRTPAQSRVLAELLIAWSQVHYYDGTIGEWGRLLEKHLTDAERSGDMALLAMYLGWLGMVQFFLPNLHVSLESGQRAVKLARTANARDALAHGLTWLSYPLLFNGRTGDAIRSAEAVDQDEVDRRENPYPYFKSRAGLSWALAYAGRLREARKCAEGIVEFGRSNGNARAESLAHYGLSIYWLLALDFARAAAVAQAGIDASKDPLYCAVNATGKAIAFAVDLRFSDAASVIDAWLPLMEQSENYIFGMQMRMVRAGADMTLGQLSPGMRRLLAGIQDFRKEGRELHATLVEVILALTYVSIARRDVTPTVGALLRNPWFVFTQAPFAASKARKLIERLRVEVESKDMRGLLGLIDLCEGRLLAHQRKKMQAGACLERIQRRLRDAGLEHIPGPVAALAAEIDQLA